MHTSKTYASTSKFSLPQCLLCCPSCNSASDARLLITTAFVSLSFMPTSYRHSSGGCMKKPWLDLGHRLLSVIVGINELYTTLNLSMEKYKSTYFSIGALGSDVMNANACLQGMPETCHCLQQHVRSAQFTTKSKAAATKQSNFSHLL